MNFNVTMLNSVNGGFKKGEMNVISCARTSPISMAYIECKYGHIVYKFLTDSPSYNLKYDIYYLKKELRQEEIRLDELKAKVDTNSSIREIEEKAKEELNMDYLKKNQIRYIEVEN